MADLFGYVAPSYLEGKTAPERNARFHKLASRPERAGRSVVNAPFGRTSPEVETVRTPEQLERATRESVTVAREWKGKPAQTTYSVMRTANAPGISELSRKKGSAIAGSTAPGRAAVEGLGTPQFGLGLVQREARPIIGDHDVVTRRLNGTRRGEPVVEVRYTKPVTFNGAR